MLKTPDFSHLSKEYSEDVYEPAEDTFLMMDALEADLPFITNIRPSICLEVGCGSGITLTSLAMALGKSTFYLATDINEKAGSCTYLTSRANCVDIDIVVDDLGSALLRRLQGLVDILIFNPPYVVTPSEEVHSRSIEASWAGGIDGREVIDRFLPIAASLISKTGALYMVAIDKNKPQEIIYLMKTLGFSGSMILSRKAGLENLLILKFIKCSVKGET